MIAKIPKHWLNNSQIPEIVNAIQPEIDNIQNIIEDFWAQIFIDTATWSLPYWERDYGLTANANDTIENRRSAVKAQMRGAKTVTLAVLQSIVDAWGGNTEVIDTGHEIHLIYHEPNGVPDNLTAMLKNLRAMTPAHLPITSERVYENPKANMYMVGVAKISAKITINPKEEVQSG